MIIEKNNLSYPILIELDEDNTFIVSCPIIKGCHSYGHTLDEAFENIKEAIELCIEADGLNDYQKRYVGIREISIGNKKMSTSYA